MSALLYFLLPKVCLLVINLLLAYLTSKASLNENLTEKSEEVLHR